MFSSHTKDETDQDIGNFAKKKFKKVEEHNIKCVVVGDGAVGKTCLLYTYTTNTFPEEYVPTVFDNYNTVLDINKGRQRVSLGLWDTGGGEDYDRLRPLSYPETLFEDNQQGLTFLLVNMYRMWVPELRHHCPGIPIIICGTKEDLLTDEKCLEELSSRGESINAVEIQRKGREITKIVGGEKYFSISAKCKPEGLKELFEFAARIVLDPSLGDNFSGGKPETKTPLLKRISNIFSTKKKKVVVSLVDEKKEIKSVKKMERIYDKNVPLDIWSNVITFYQSIDDFFKFYLLCKDMNRYINVQNPSCCRNIIFTFRKPPKNKKTKFEFVYKLRFNKIHRSKLKGFFVDDYRDFSSLTVDFSPFPNIDGVILESMLIKVKDFNCLKRVKKYSIGKNTGNNEYYNSRRGYHGLIDTSFDVKKFKKIRKNNNHNYQTSNALQLQELQKHNFPFLKTMSDLEELEFSSGNIFFNEECLQYFPKLKKISIFGSNIVQIFKGEAFGKLPKLTELNLGMGYYNYGGGNENAPSFNVSYSKFLTKLLLDGIMIANKVEFEFLKVLTLKRCIYNTHTTYNLPKLETLIIEQHTYYYGQLISNFCDSIIGDSLTMENLRKLSITNGKLKDSVLILPKLIELKVTNCTNFTGKCMDSSKNLRCLHLSLYFYGNDSKSQSFDPKYIVSNKLESVKFEGSLPIPPKMIERNTNLITIEIINGPKNIELFANKDRMRDSMKNVQVLRLKQVMNFYRKTFDFGGFNNLRELVFSGSEKIEFLSFTEMKNLKLLSIGSCKMLTQITFGDIPSLQSLSLKALNHLKAVIFVSKPENVKKLEIDCCGKLTFDSKFINENLCEGFEELVITDNSIITDEIIEKFPNLQVLRLCRCPKINGSFITSMDNLRDLSLKEMFDLEDIILQHLPHKTLLKCEFSFLPKFFETPSYFENLSQIIECKFGCLSKLDDRIFGYLKKCQVLELDYCGNIEGVGIKKMKCLRTIKVDTCFKFKKDNVDEERVTFEFKSGYAYGY